MSAPDSRPALPIHLPFDSISPSFSKNSPCVFQVLGYYLTSLAGILGGRLLCAYECNAELERTQKLLQQYENRNKMLNRKLSVEKRKERNHRIFLFGGFMESIVPELKTMTEDEGKDFLYHIAKSTEAQEYLKKRAEGVEAG